MGGKTYETITEINPEMIRVWERAVKEEIELKFENPRDCVSTRARFYEVRKALNKFHFQGVVEMNAVEIQRPDDLTLKFVIPTWLKSVREQLPEDKDPHPTDEAGQATSRTLHEMYNLHNPKEDI